MAHRLIDSAALLEEALDSLEDSLEKSEVPRLYLDTEFESNRTGTKLCLLQISAGEDSFLIDPLRLKSLDPLGDLLADGKIEWVLHAGLQDVELVTKNLRVDAPSRILDTQIAWALLSAEASVSLAYLQYVLLDMRSEKAHQADDWVRRPLQASQLRYAASDVDHLPEMTRLLLARAKGLGNDRVELLYAASRDSLSPMREPPAPLDLSSFRNAWQLSPKSQSALRFLMVWYNGLPAEARTHAPENKTLLAIASRSPDNVGDLSRIKGVSRGTINHYGQAIVDGIARAIKESNGDDFVPLDPPPYGTFKEILTDAWLSQYKAELAVSLKFSPELVLPGRLLKRMGAGVMNDGVEGLYESLVGWRRSFLLGPSREFCERTPPPV